MPGDAVADSSPRRVLCAHADQDGAGAHWKLEGEPCPLAGSSRDGVGRAVSNNGLHTHRYGTVDDTTWPVDVGDLEWALRYDPDSLTREHQLVIASVVHAYMHLISPHRTHGDAVVSLRRARKAAGRE